LSGLVPLSVQGRLFLINDTAQQHGQALCCQPRVRQKPDSQLWPSWRHVSETTSMASFVHKTEQFQLRTPLSGTVQFMYTRSHGGCFKNAPQEHMRNVPAELCGRRLLLWTCESDPEAQPGNPDPLHDRSGQVRESLVSLPGRAVRGFLLRGIDFGPQAARREALSRRCLLAGPFLRRLLSPRPVLWRWSLTSRFVLRDVFEGGLLKTVPICADCPSNLNGSRGVMFCSSLTASWGNSPLPT